VNWFVSNNQFAFRNTTYILIQ